MKIYILKFSLIFSLLTLFICCSEEDNVGLTNIEVAEDQIIVEGSSKYIHLETTPLQLRAILTPSDAYNKNLFFSIANTEVATVSQNGIITPKTSGTTELTITADNGVSVTYTIVVAVKIKSITVSPSSIVLESTREFNLASSVTVLPNNASNKNLSYTSSDTSIVKVDDKGVITGRNLGEATITIETLDGSERSAVASIVVVDKITGPVLYDRSKWTATVSHDLPLEGGNNKPSCIIDGDKSTFLSMVKPGYSMEGINVDISEKVFFILDLKEKLEVDFFKYEHRNAYETLRFFAVTILGSDNGTDFTLVAENVTLPKASDGGAETIETGNITIPKSEYRYYKIEFADWLKTSAPGQLREFYLGHTIED